MQIAAHVEQNFMHTSKAYDLGRGNRSDPVEGIPQFPPGPGRYAHDSTFDKNKDQAKGFE